MNANAKAWVAALRSGEFTQGRMHLRDKVDGQNEFCCLGVACELYRRAHKDTSGWQDATILFANDENQLHSDTSYLPWPVKQWLGMETKNGHYKNGERSLTNDNDNMKLNFEQIANVIEQNERELFK